MREEFRYMAELPGTPAEQAWVREYLETLSEWEGVVLAASVSRRLPASAEDAVNHLLSLRGGSVYLSADNYKGLGERWLRAAAKDALGIQSLDECTLLEARCVLPEAGAVQNQYDSVEDLVRDGNNLGFILAERGQGTAHWLERFAAARVIL